MRVAELRASDRSAEELKVAVPYHLEVSREGAHVHRGGSSSSKHKLALVLEMGFPRAKLQTDLRALNTELIYSGADSSGFTSQAQVVQVRVNQLKSPGGAEASQLRQNRLEGQGEEQRTQGVALLNTHLRRDNVRAEHEFGRRRVAILDPRRQAGEAVAHFAQEGEPIDRVEGVSKVKFNKHLVGLVLVAAAPLLRNLRANFSTQRERNANLKGREVIASSLLA